MTAGSAVFIGIMERRSPRLRRGHAFLTILLLLCGSAGCSSKTHPSPPPPPDNEGGLATPPPEVPASILQWAGAEDVVVVEKADSVALVAPGSGRSRTLRSAGARHVILDAEYDLLWIAGPRTLDVIDLRAPGEAVIPIADDLPACSAPLGILRDLAGGTTSSLDEQPRCETQQSLTFEWRREPRWRFMGVAPSGEVKEQVSGPLAGARWLHDQFARTTSGAYVKGGRRELVNGAPSLVPVPPRPLNCGIGSPCGLSVPFGTSGQLLVVTDYWQGDCQHLGCRLYQPATKTFSSPPEASWKEYGRAAALSEEGSPASAPAELRKVAPGSCGVYHFDRSGKRFLLGDKLCPVGAQCQDLGGAGVGWLSGGTDIGDPP